MTPMSILEWELVGFVGILIIGASAVIVVLVVQSIKECGK